MSDVSNVQEPALNPQQSQWINALGMKFEAAAKSRAKAAKREEAQQKIEDALGPLREQIQADQFYEISTGLKGLFRKAETISSLDPGGDPMKEIDSWHDLPGSQSLPPEKIKKIGESLKLIVELSRDMRQMTDEQGNKVYEDDADLAKDLWQPLAREGILPENAIPDRFSEVKETFTAAVDLYEERLQEHSKGMTTAKQLMEKFNKVSAVIEAGLKAGSAVVGAVGGVQAAEQGTTAGNVQGSRDLADDARIINLTALCLASTREAATGIVESRDLVGALDHMNAMTRGILRATVGDEVATMVYGCVAAAARTAKTGEHLYKGDHKAALKELGDAIAAATSAADKSDTKVLRAVGMGFQAALTAVAIPKGKPDEILAAVMSQASNVANRVAKDALSAQQAAAVAALEDDPDKEDKLVHLNAWFTSRKDTVSDGTKELSASINEIPGLLELNKKIKAGIDEGALKELNEEAQKAADQELKDFMESPDEDFDNLLINGFSTDDPGMDEEKRLRSLERLIEVQKKHQKTFELAKNICQGGTKFVQNLFPPAGLAAAGTALIFSIMEAVKHAQQLTIWGDNVKDAGSAGTVQLDAMMNRYGLQSSQALQADILVATKAAAVVGEALKLGGVTAPAGLATVAVAQATEGIMTVAALVVKEAKMADAWKTYQKALETPQDRKLVREALRKNPTLAKYAMAYGAVVAKNAIAIKGMTRCGLNEKTLADPASNVGKVVEYLELVYKEDPTLLKAVPVKQAWYPGTPTLTLASWASFYLKATTTAEPKLAAQDTSRVDVAMDAFENADKEVQSISGDLEPDQVTEIFQKAIDAANTLTVALVKFKPLSATDQTPHKEMAEYLECISAQVRLRSGGLPKELDAALAKAQKEAAEKKMAAELKAMEEHWEDEEDDEEEVP